MYKFAVNCCFLFVVCGVQAVVASTERHRISLPNGVGSVLINIENNATTVQNNTQHNVMTQTTSVPPYGPHRQSLTNNPLMAAVREHPWLALGVAVGGVYIVTVASLYGVAYYCTHSCRWANWKSELSAEQIAHAKSAVALELFETLNKVYVCQHKQGDFLTPLVCFINDLDRELKWHYLFLSTHKWLDDHYIHPVFPQQQLERARIIEQGRRLIALRGLLVRWLSSYYNDGDVDAVPAN